MIKAPTAAAIPSSHDGLHDHEGEGVLVRPRRPLEGERKVSLGFLRREHSLVSAGEDRGVGLFFKVSRQEGVFVERGRRGRDQQKAEKIE